MVLENEGKFNVEWKYLLHTEPFSRTRKNTDVNDAPMLPRPRRREEIRCGNYLLRTREITKLLIFY